MVVRRKLGSWTLRFGGSLLLVWLVGCVEPPPPATETFQRAEEHFRRGHHDEARALYTAFLRDHPDSLLAPMAANRLEAIDREVDAIMGRRGTPAPVRTPARLPLDHAPVQSGSLQRLEAPQLPGLTP